MQAANLEELSENHTEFFGYLSEMTLGFVLRELRWHGKLIRKRRHEVEVELCRRAKLYERRPSLFQHD